MSAKVGSISTMDAVRAHRRMQRLVVARGRLRIALWGIAALPVALTAMLLGWSKGPGLWTEVLELTLRFLVPLSPAIAMAGLVGDEVDRQTATFLLSRPAPRWTLLAGRALAVAPTIVASLSASLVLSYGIAMSRGDLRDVGDTWGLLLRALVAVLLAVPAYAAGAAAIGTWWRRQPMVAVGAWILAVEVGIGTLPSRFAMGSIAYHLRAVAGTGGDGEAGVAAAVGGAAAMVMATAIAAVIAARVMDRIELSGGE